MKMLQENKEFSPIAIVLESREDVDAFWFMLICVAANPASPGFKLAKKMSDWFSNEAKL